MEVIRKLERNLELTRNAQQEIFQYMFCLVKSRYAIKDIREASEIRWANQINMGIEIQPF